MLLGALFFHQGIHADKEALKYIGCAEAVLQGDLTDLTGNYLKYAGYVAFLLPFVAIGEPLLAVLAQVVLGIIAARALGRLTARISGSASLGDLSMALFLLCPLIQTWTLALYTEHFFLCLSVLFLEQIERTTWNHPNTVVMGLFVLTTRPVGVLFVVPALLWKWSASRPTVIRNSFLVIGTAMLLAGALSIPRIARPQLEPIASGQVVAGVGGTDATGFDGRTILDAQRFLLGRTSLGEWSMITLQRMASLFTLTRPYFSTEHNAVNGLFYALYPLALVGLWRSRHDDRIHLLIVVLLLNAFLAGLTHDEWSGRFIVPLIPHLIVLACSAFARR